MQLGTLSLDRTGRVPTTYPGQQPFDHIFPTSLLNILRSLHYPLIGTIAPLQERFIAFQSFVRAIQSERPSTYSLEAQQQHDPLDTSPHFSKTSLKHLQVLVASRLEQNGPGILCSPKIMTRTTQSAATPDASAPEVSTKQELRRSKRHKTNSGQTVGASVAVDNTTDSDYVEEASSGKRKRITESKSQAKTNARGTRSKKNTTPANARAPHVEDVDEETDERAGDAALAGDAASRDATIEAEKVRIKRELAPHDYGLPPQDVLMYDSLGLNHYMKQYRHHWTSPASDVPTTIPEKLYWVLQLFIAMTDMKLLPKGQNGANRMVASQGWENAAGPFITGEGYDTLPVWIRCHEIVVRLTTCCQWCRLIADVSLGRRHRVLQYWVYTSCA